MNPERNLGIDETKSILEKNIIDAGMPQTKLLEERRSVLEEIDIDPIALMKTIREKPGVLSSVTDDGAVTYGEADLHALLDFYAAGSSLHSTEYVNAGGHSASAFDRVAAYEQAKAAVEAELARRDM